MGLFTQANFSAGMNLEVDPTKTPKDSYRLLINGRSRRDVIEPTRKHLELAGPFGSRNYQGLYAAGSILVLFADGLAYYADLLEASILFRPIQGFLQMNPDVQRIYAELVPASSNQFSRQWITTPDDTARVYSNTIAAFPQALFVWDGTDAATPSGAQGPQAISPTGQVVQLGNYNTWSKNFPEYVPFGKLPCQVGNKLFLVSPDGKQIYQGVSGRSNDFMVNITQDGDKGGDASTVSAAVSFNPITALKPLSTGQVLVSTLYASFALELDYANPIFGEPYLNVVYLFPTGAVNDLSSIPLVAQTDTGFFSDTAFITQTGIHSFNAVAQAQRESNNYPIGAKIHGLLLNPQQDTCATNFDDYGFFAVNTIFGYGAVLYDTIRQNWASLDLSFGRVKQFATTRITGQERLFYITADNRIFEAFAGEGYNTTRIYVGEWTPESADQNALVHMVDCQFLNVLENGQVKYSLYSDGELQDSAIVEMVTQGFAHAYPIPIPFLNAKKTVGAGWQFNKIKGWNFGLMIEWNFAGALSEINLDGKIQTADSVDLAISQFASNESFAVIGCSGYADELNSFTDFTDGFLCVPVTKGQKYIYAANGNGRLMNGHEVIHDLGVFTAKGSSVAVEGQGSATFSLRTATDYIDVLQAIANAKVDNLLGAGNHSYDVGSQLDVDMGYFPLRQAIKTTPGGVDVITAGGKYFYAKYAIAGYYKESYNYVDVFFFNSNDSSEVQKQWLQIELAKSTKPFKLVVSAAPAALPFSTWGASALITSSDTVLEITLDDNFPTFISGGAGGFRGTVDEDAYFSSAVPGYLHIEADPLTCLMTFRDTDNNILDTYALYA